MIHLLFTILATLVTMGIGAHIGYRYRGRQMPEPWRPRLPPPGALAAQLYRSFRDACPVIAVGQQPEFFPALPESQQEGWRAAAHDLALALGESAPPERGNVQAPRAGTISQAGEAKVTVLVMLGACALIIAGIILALGCTAADQQRIRTNLAMCSTRAAISAIADPKLAGAAMDKLRGQNWEPDVEGWALDVGGELAGCVLSALALPAVENAPAATSPADAGLGRSVAASALLPAPIDSPEMHGLLTGACPAVGAIPATCQPAIRAAHFLAERHLPLPQPRPRPASVDMGAHGDGGHGIPDGGL